LSEEKEKQSAASIPDIERITENKPTIAEIGQISHLSAFVGNLSAK
jgi:hypothetical protein